MKTLIITLAAFFTLSSMSFAGDSIKTRYSFKDDNLKDRYITVESQKEFLEVTTEHTTYRIYPCGKLDKLTWTELNRNEDELTINYMRTWPNGGFIVTGASNALSNK